MITFNLNECFKLLVCYIDKSYSLEKVSKECFNISPKIEDVGLFSSFKIFKEDDLNFRINELNRLGFKEDISNIDTTQQ